MPKGPHEYTHNDSGKTHINFLRFKQKKDKFRKERKLAIESWARVTTLICYRATETENNDKTDQRIWGLVASIFMRSYIPLTIREQWLSL